MWQILTFVLLVLAVALHLEVRKVRKWKARLLDDCLKCRNKGEKKMENMTAGCGNCGKQYPGRDHQKDCPCGGTVDLQFGGDLTDVLSEEIMGLVCGYANHCNIPEKGEVKEIIQRFLSP